jgi:hypothetical protein
MMGGNDFNFTFEFFLGTVTSPTPNFFHACLATRTRPDNHLKISAPVEPPIVFSELFEVLQIVIDADQKMAICPLRC